MSLYLPQSAGTAGDGGVVGESQQLDQDWTKGFSENVRKRRYASAYSKHETRSSAKNASEVLIVTFEFPLIF